MPKIAEAITETGTARFPPALCALLRAVVPYTYTVIFGYCGNAKPLDLYDDFPAHKRKIFVTDYQEGPYLLDPFFLAAARPVAAGLYRMRDLAPDRFYQGEYFRNYYVQTGLAEEVGFFVDLPGGANVVLSLMRDKKPFTSRAMRDLNEVRPVVEAMLRGQWASLTDRFQDAGQVPGKLAEGGIEQSLQSFGMGVLTAREREIVEYSLKGHSAEATSRILGIASGTVRIHRRNIYLKLGISSQGELFSRFIQTLGVK
jgi:DNA-binding CsgD family transcriptional regulator